MTTDKTIKEGASCAPDAKLVLVTGATGDTGRPTVRLLLEKGHRVRAMVRKEDERADALRQLGAEVVVGNFLELNEVRAAIKGVSTAYFVYPLAGGIVEASVIFA